MGYGIKLKKPAFTKDTRLYTLKRIPEVLIPVEDYHTVTVSNGDRVKIGTLLGVSLTPQTPMLSSISGTVSGIYSIKGREYVRIVNDNKYELSETLSPCKKRLSEMNRTELIERIRVCGIPEWKAISEAKGISRFVINCTDADPYSNVNKCIIKSKRRELIGGAKIIMKLLSVRMCEFAIERNETDAVNMLIDSIGDSRLFDIVEISPKYPYGKSERLITQLPDSEQLDENELFVISPESVCAVYAAFAKGHVHIRRAVSVGGSAAYAGGTYLLPLGTPIKYLTDNVTDNEDGSEPFTVIKNGVMTGARTTAEDAVITSRTHSLSYVRNSDLCATDDICISCGRCDSVCPEGLLPSLFIEKHSDDFDKAVGLSGMDMCSECGACTYVCPAKLPIHDIACNTASLPKPNEYQKKTTRRHAPFISSKDSTATINLDLSLCLLVLLIWSVCVFGARALLVSLISVTCAVTSDLFFSVLTRSSPRSPLDLNSVVCGLMCAATMTVRVPLYLCAVAPVIAVILVRGAFGGKSKNLIHSAFCARVFISLLWHEPFIHPERPYTMFDRILGNTAGGFGEISAILITVCALYLIIRKIIPIIPTVTALFSFAVITFLTSEAGNAASTVSVSLLGSAILFVSVFASSEYSTIPKGMTGRAAYGIICGAVSALILRFTDYEGAYIAAILASVLTVPLFSRIRQAEPTYAGESATPEREVDLEAIFGTDEEKEPAERDISAHAAPENVIDKNVPEVQDVDLSYAQEQPHASKKAEAQADENAKNTDNGKFDTESFHIETAQELLSILTAELGMSINEQNEPAQKGRQDTKKDADFSTAAFDLLYNEVDVDTSAEKRNQKQ